MKIQTVFLGLIISMFSISCASSAKKYASPEEWVAESKVGQQLPLGTKVDEWSQGKNFNINSSTIEVKSQFIKHHGSTCHYNVQFTNVGTTPVSTIGGITTQERVNIYSHNSGKINLDAGKSVTYKDLEARECPIIFGTSTDMNGCAACKAWIVFTK